jgi:DNA-binding transcriptional MerR regulator
VIIAKEGVSIGEAAQRLNLSEDTLRYYERVGLTPPVDRASSGHRRYSEDDLRWFFFVTRMRAAGMPIETLQRYAALTREGDHTAPARRAILEGHRSNIETQIEELRGVLEIVKHKIERLESGRAHAS